jgi:transposase
VIIGVGPAQELGHDRGRRRKRKVQAVSRHGTDKAGYSQMLKAGRIFGQRIWAVEGCNGISDSQRPSLVGESTGHIRKMCDQLARRDVASPLTRGSRSV